MCSLPELRDYVDGHRGLKGVRQARCAVELTDPASGSPGESRLRVCYRREAGLPKPLVNVPLFDRTGALLGIADLFDDVAGLVAEYDGALHRGRRQHHADNLREERLESAGLTVVRVYSLDLDAHRDLLIGRLRDGWQRGMRRDRTSDRWTRTEPEWWSARQDPSADLTADELTEIFRDS